MKKIYSMKIFCFKNYCFCLIFVIFVGKNFRQRISYLVHRRIHTGVMPYKCNVCDKSFRYKVSQKSHKCVMSNIESVNGTENDKSITEKRPKIVNDGINKCVATTSAAVVSKGLPSGELLELASIEKKVAPQKTSILLSCNPHIEITYNAADLESAIQNNLVDEDSLPLLTCDSTGTLNLK